MKTGNIADNRVGLAPNPEEKPKVVKKPLSKKANATPKKPLSPKNEAVLPKNTSKKAKTPATVAPKKQTTAKVHANASPKTKINKNAPKYRFNSPSNQELSANNFEEIYKLEGHGLSRSEFKRQMK